MPQSRIHAAIIMDGNGRWAAARSLSRAEGHRAGAEALRGIVETAPSIGIAMLTVYAFSSDNWKRPADEVSSLMSLLACFLESETPRCVANGIRLSVIGRRDRLHPPLVGAISRAELDTCHGRSMHLRLAIDYSARAAIESGHLDNDTTVDLLIRTGGEQRLSDFLLWESAYAELFFTPVMWPDFTPRHLAKIVHQFGRRERRFGSLNMAVQDLRGKSERWLS